MNYIYQIYVQLQYIKDRVQVYLSNIKDRVQVMYQHVLRLRNSRKKEPKEQIRSR